MKTTPLGTSHQNLHKHNPDKRMHTLLEKWQDSQTQMFLAGLVLRGHGVLINSQQGKNDIKAVEKEA